MARYSLVQYVNTDYLFSSNLLTLQHASSSYTWNLEPTYFLVSHYYFLNVPRRLFEATTTARNTVLF